MPSTEIKAKSVLVVDDDREISRLIKYNLEDNDTQVLQANSALEAIRILLDGRVSLVLLDLKLPDFNGWGILSLLKLTESLARIPVIVVSVEPVNRAMVERFRPDDYIQKPFDMRDLLTRVKKVMVPVGA